VGEICERVAKALHNTSSVAKSKYIDPIVWAEIEEKFGIKVLKPKV
jgi:DNA topoisomerase IB